MQSCLAYFKMKPEIFEEFLVHMFCRIVAIDSVVPGWVVHDIDRLVRTDAGLYKPGRILGVNVVIVSPVHQQQFTLKFIHKRYRRS